MRYVLIFTFLIFSSAVNGQVLNFDQTVAYIKKYATGRVMYPGALDAYDRVKGYTLKDIKIDKNGSIQLSSDQKFDSNDFSISFNIFDLIEKVDYPDGIRAYKFLVHFNGLNVSQGYGIAFATDADAQKLARAFRHLKTVCVQEDDPFSKPTEVEKNPTANREETINYINDILSSHPSKFTTVLCSHCTDKKYKGATITIQHSYPENALRYDEYNKQYTITHNVLKQPSIAGFIVNNNNYEWTFKVKAIPVFIISKPIQQEEVVSGDTNELIIENCVRFYIGGMDDSTLGRFKKALTRLFELDKPGKDPFGN